MDAPLEADYYTDRVREFFAFLPVKTITGWAWAVDCVEVWTFSWEKGWSGHYEVLPQWRAS